MVHPFSPTAVLPALATLSACNAVRVGQALQTLRDLYFPRTPPSTPAGALPALRQSLSAAVTALRHKRITRVVHHDDVPDSGYASAEENDQDENGDEEEELDILRLDALERGYAIKWLTGFAKRGDAWIDLASSDEQTARTACLEDASRLLARFAGDDEPEEALTRTFIFSLSVPARRRGFGFDASPISIQVELNDAPVDGSDHTAVGLQSWGSAIVFAERICRDPERYLGGMHTCPEMPFARRRRVLELGAGTGLLSITAAQILSRMAVGATIDATDYHPGVLENLAWNVGHNRVDVSVQKLDWCAPEPLGVDGDVEGDMGTGMYDVVLAADVIYHPEHACWIRGCIERMMKKNGVFWLIIPVRTIGRHEGLGKTVEEAFPVVDGLDLREGECLGIVRREEVKRVERVGRADEGGYTLFEIRWV